MWIFWRGEKRKDLRHKCFFFSLDKFLTSKIFVFMAWKIENDEKTTLLKWWMWFSSHFFSLPLRRWLCLRRVSRCRVKKLMTYCFSFAFSFFFPPLKEIIMFNNFLKKDHYRNKISTGWIIKPDLVRYAFNFNLLKNQFSAKMSVLIFRITFMKIP